MGGDKKPSFEFFQSGHGKTVIAEATLTDEAISRVLRTTAEDLEALSWVGHARRRRVGHAVGRVHAGVGDRSGLRRDRARTSAWSARARWRTAPAGASTAACTRRSASRASRSAPSAAARRSRRAHEWLGAHGLRRRPGKVYRFAQIVAAAALALEISASAAMATAGSENFFRAHFERGGMRARTLRDSR